ncbi:MAG: hypothetical protein R3F61_23155 [Myxococcota bacterium]
MGRKSLLQVEDISRELDLVVFRLERPVDTDTEALIAERRKLRRELESLRDRLTDVVRDLE